MRLADELRQKMPTTGRAADHENSRAAAIKLFCLECMGGSRSEVARCDTHACPLWLYRPYGETTRPDGVVPTVGEYGAMAEEATSDAQRAAREESAKRLRGDL